MSDATHSAQGVSAAVARMKAWAAANPHADTQGLMDDEWVDLARAALGVPSQGHEARMSVLDRLEAFYPDRAPKDYPAWNCPDCGQHNAGWSVECGRCGGLRSVPDA